jgi:hypothetical protein
MRLVFERTSGVSVAVGKHYPQLKALDDGAGRCRHLRMTDPRAGGRDIELAGSDECPYASAVAVLDLTMEEPTDGL